MSDQPVAIPLNIQEELAKRGVKGKMSLIVEGMPVGASLTAGTNNWDNTWSLVVSDLHDLHFVPSPDADGVHTLSIRVLRYDSDGYDVAATAALFELEVDCTTTHQAEIAQPLAVEFNYFMHELSPQSNSNSSFQESSFSQAG